MTSTSPRHATVVVAGGGPIGLVTALGLARRGVDVMVLERETDVFRAPRAMSYHWSCLYGLDDLGLLDDMTREGFLVHDITYHVLATGENVTFSLEALEGRVAHPYNLTLGQDRFAEVVLRHLAEHDNVDVRWGVEIGTVTQSVDRVAVEVTADGETSTVTGDWLVTTQGARSSVRQQLGLGFAGLTWPHRFVATNVRHDFLQQGLGVGNLVIDPDFGAVVAKITSDGLWRVTWSEDAAMPDVDLGDRVRSQFTALIPGGREVEVLSTSTYRMHQRAAESLRVGRVLIAGDAGHVTNPTSGFGLVGGLHDSYVLSEALSAVVREECAPDILDRYSQDRLTVFWTVTSPLSTESKRLVFHSDDPDRLGIDLQMYRRIASDADLTRGFWSQSARLESPSVVTGSPLSAGRNAIVPR